MRADSRRGVFERGHGHRCSQAERKRSASTMTSRCGMKAPVATATSLPLLSSETEERPSSPCDDCNATNAITREVGDEPRAARCSTSSVETAGTCGRRSRSHARGAQRM